MWDILALPFAACLVIAGIHCYLGMHVLTRGIIFVDLALAQLATLGTTLALLWGYEIGSTQAYACGLALTVIGAALFSLAGRYDTSVPQEALIGITYAVSSALSILVLERTPHGEEEVRAFLVGAILYVAKADLWRLLITFAIIGAFHFMFRERFLLLSQDRAAAHARGWSLGLWDFLFYLSFGVVITNAVRVAGVLLVFSYLVVPASCAVMLVSGVRKRLGLGWALGFAASALGLWASARWDVEAGAAVVASLGAFLGLVLVLRPLLGRPFRKADEETA